MSARILVADEGESARTLLATTLSHLGTVIVAENAEQAFELLHTGRFDVVVADTKASLDAPELLRVSLALEYRPRVVLLTDPSTTHPEAFECVGKPVDPEQLKSAVSRALGRHPCPAVDLASLTYREALERVRTEGVRRYLHALLERFAGNVTAAAAHADLERESFYRLCRRYGVLPTEFRGGGDHDD